MTENGQMRNKVMEFCRKEGLLEPGLGVVVGVSGGADSVCLLRLLCLFRRELGLRIYAVHVHHGIRGQEADEDQAYVQRLCGEWETELRCFRVDVPAMAAREGLSTEEAGRNARYRILEEVRRQTESERIAVAHHMDDQAETVLMNLLRGSGIRGTAGIRPRRGKVIRPLLCVRRSEIEQWLTEQGIVWRTDRTNLEDGYFRNRIRNRLLPEIENTCNRKAVEHIAQMANDLQEADAYFTAEAARLLDACQPEQEAGVREEICRLLAPPAVGLSLELLSSQSPLMAAYLVREGLERLGGSLKDISRSHIQSVLALAKSSGAKTVMLPDHRTARLAYDRILLEKKPDLAQNVNFQVTFCIFSFNNEKKVPQNCCVNWFDYDKIAGSIKLRYRRPGDRICVMAGGKYKKLKEYMIDAKMPACVRDRWPVLAMDSRVLWIPGYRMDEDCKVDRNTRLVLQAQIHRER